MADKLTTSSQHITSLDFNIMPAVGSLETLEARFNQSMREIQARANQSINLGKVTGRGAIGQVTDEMREMTQMESQFRRRMGWFFSGTLFYGTLTGAKQAVAAMRDVETAVMKVGRVMEDATFQTAAYRDELLDLASEYGQDFDVAADIALQFAQAGYNVKDSLDMTRTSLLAVNSAELDVQNATSSMIGIMAQWNLTAAEMPLALDKINKTGDDFTVTSQDLVDGLLRSSQAAQVMGMSFDETIATLTVMREASGRTGREVGNALNSILSYIQRPIAIQTLEGLGISMFTDEAKTQFRNFQEIIADIAAKMPEHGATINKAFVEAAGGAENLSEEMKEVLGTQEEWTDLQQRDIAQSAAGVYRRNYFIALLQRQSKIQEVLNGMTDAEGYSMQENARYMETLEAQVKTFSAEVLKLVTTLGDNGILDLTKDIVSLGTDGTRALDSFVETAGAIPPILAALMASLGLFSKQMQTFKVAADIAPGTPFGGLRGNDLNGMVRALKSVNEAYRVQVSLARMEGINDPTRWQRASMAVTAFSRSLNVAGVAAKALGFALNMAINIMAGLAIGLAIQKIYELVNAQKEAAAQANATAQEMKDQQKAIQELQEQYVDLIKSGKDDADSKKELIRIERQLKELLGETAGAIDLQNGSLEENIRLINEASKAKLDEFLTTQRMNYERALRTKSETDTEYISVFSGLSQASFPIKGNLEQKIGQITTAMKEWNNKSAEGSQNDKLREKVLDALNKRHAELNQTLSEADKTITAYEAAEEQVIPTLKEQADITKDAALANEDFADSTKKLTDLQSKLAESSQNISAVQKALDEYSETGRFNLDTLIQLAEKHTQLLPLLGDEKAVYQELTSIIENERKTAEQAYVSMLESSTEFYDAKILGNATLVKELNDKYGIDLKNYKTLAEAKLEVEKVLLNKLSSAWAEYYDIERRSLTTDYTELSRVDPEAAMKIRDAIAKANEMSRAFDNITLGASNVDFSGLGLGSGSSSKKEKEIDLYLKEQAALDEVNTQLERNTRLREFSSDNRWLALAQERLGLYSLEKTAINNLMEAKKQDLAMSKQGTKEYADLKNSINSLYLDWMDIDKDIADLQKEITENYTRKQQAALDDINSLLDQNATLRERAEGDEWLDLSGKRIELYTREKSAINSLIEAKRKELALTEQGTSAYYDLKKTIDDLYGDWLNSENEIIALQKESADHYQDLMRDRMDQIEKAKDKAIRAIEDEYDAYIAAEERKLDRLTDKEDTRERERYLEDYEKKRAELLKERQYHEVRTGEEHRKAIIDIDEQLADLEQDLTRQKEDWKTEDERSAIQDRINQLEEERDEKTAIVEDAYARMQEIMDEAYSYMENMSGETAEEMFRLYEENFFDPLEEAFEDLDFGDIEDIVEGKVPKPSKTTKSDKTSQSDKKTSSSSSGTYSDPMSWEEFYDKYGYGIFDIVKKNGQTYNVDKKTGIVVADDLPSAATGGYTATEGAYNLHPGELIVRPDLTKALQNFLKPYSSGGTVSSVDNSRKVSVDKAVNIENAYFNDSSDETSLGREVARRILVVSKS